jgi:hypothetical protein
VTSDAFAGITVLKRILVSKVPLAVEVASHVDNIVNNLGDSGDREILQVPVRCWRCNRYYLLGAKLLPENGKESEILHAVVFFADGLIVDIDVRSL